MCVCVCVVGGGNNIKGLMLCYWNKKEYFRLLFKNCRCFYTINRLCKVCVIYNDLNKENKDTL